MANRIVQAIYDLKDNVSAKLRTIISAQDAASQAVRPDSRNAAPPIRPVIPPMAAPASVINNMPMNRTMSLTPTPRYACIIR